MKGLNDEVRLVTTFEFALQVAEAGGLAQLVATLRSKILTIDDDRIRRSLKPVLTASHYTVVT